MAPEKRTTRFGIFEIKLLFLVLLGFCLIALVTKLVYLRWESEVSLSFPEPTPEPGWNQEFEMNLDNKWIVAVSKTKRKLSRPVREKGYTVVYVPHQFDENDSQMCRAQDCIYLDPQEQTSMTFKVMKHLPKGKEESRRLMGFLYAMSRGARVIYYKNVHHNPGSSSSIPFLYSNTVMEYTLDPDSVTELRKTKFNQSSSLFVPWLIYHKYVLVREGWENPTRPSKHKGEENTEHDSHVRSRSGNGFTVLHSSISSFQYKSYWALIFHTVYGGIGHALIGRLMQEITTGADFTGIPFAQVNWSPESGFSREKEAKERKRLDVILKHWECDPSLRFFSCIINIGLTLLRKKIISHKYCEIIKFWILDLLVIGAHEPVRRFHVRTTVQKLPNSTNLADTKDPPGYQAFSEACPETTLLNNIQVIDDIALIIVFNEAPLYSNIPLLESMYRGYFKHMIYCGPYLDSFTKHSTDLEEITHFLFIEALKQGWHYFYECLMLASQLNTEVKGYIQIGDDTLLNPWNLKTLPRNKMWLHSGIDALNISLEETNPHWVWWQSRWGKPAVLNSLDSIFSKAGADSTFTSFKKTYLANSNNLTFIYRQSGDFMYMPMVHVNEYLKIGSIFLNNEAMVEVAHGTIVMGIAPYKDIEFINDGSLYASDKKLTFWTSYNRSDVFLHPFKLSYIKENPNVRSVFCDKYMVDSEKELLTEGAFVPFI